MSPDSNGRVPAREEVWDAFIDALDRAGQAGSAADVVVPSFAAGPVGGRKFGDLEKDDVKALSRVATALGRRGDTVLTMWDDMRRRARGPRKSTRK